MADCPREKEVGILQRSIDESLETPRSETKLNNTHPADSSEVGGEEVITGNPSVSIGDEWRITIDPLVIDDLSQGFLQKLQPGLAKSKSLLEELTENQRILIETVQQENVKFDECQAYKEVSETMEMAKIYQTKLLIIKKDMILLHEKSAKLKKRALKMKQQKEKEQLEREQQAEAELERERALVAKPAKKSPSSS